MPSSSLKSAIERQREYRKRKHGEKNNESFLKKYWMISEAIRRIQNSMSLNE